ncbi:MAG: guanylate kinase [Chloroflexi bacterium]|jgi:guanylate kinase|nr:guanylate kinase [Chloroflexota bacterium]
MTEKTPPFNFYDPQPLMIVISGISAAGKDSVVRHLEKRGLPIHFVVTATSRPPRPNETHGVDYFFVTRAEFEQMIADDELIEYAKVYSDYKGVPKAQVRQAMASGKDVVMRIDVQGAKTMREKFPEAVLIFLTTNSEEEFIQRLTARGTESPEEMQLRIVTAYRELETSTLFDYVVINANDHLDEAVNDIIAIISAEHHRVEHRKVSL